MTENNCSGERSGNWERLPTNDNEKEPHEELREGSRKGDKLSEAGQIPDTQRKEGGNLASTRSFLSEEHQSSNFEKPLQTAAVK